MYYLIRLLFCRWKPFYLSYCFLLVSYDIPNRDLLYISISGWLNFGFLLNWYDTLIHYPYYLPLPLLSFPRFLGVEVTNFDFLVLYRDIRTINYCTFVYCFLSRLVKLSLSNYLPSFWNVISGRNYSRYIRESSR